MSGDEPTRRATSGSKGGKKRAGARDVADDKPALRPFVLIPTPAQVAAGQRLVTAEEDDIPRTVALFRDRTLAAGWSAQVTYSHIWDVPPATGRWAGRWVPKHIMCVRFWHLRRRLRAYASWSCADDGSGAAAWSSDGGQAQIIGNWPTTKVGVVALGKMVAGDLTVKWAPVRFETAKRGGVEIHYGFILG